MIRARSRTELEHEVVRGGPRCRVWRLPHRTQAQHTAVANVCSAQLCGVTAFVLDTVSPWSLESALREAP